MQRFIDNLYYRFYRLIISFGEKSIPRYNAVLLMSIFSILNFITVLVIAIIVTEKIIIVNLPKGYLFGIGLLIIALNSYLIFSKKRYLEIERRFEKEEGKARVKNNLTAIAYILLTILFLVLSLVYLNNHPITKRG